MFISKSEYKMLNDLVDAYKEERNKLMDKCKSLESSNENLIFTTRALRDQNETLVNWIDKIINDVGCYKVDKDCNIQIPVYEENNNKPFYSINQEIIRVPSIKIIKRSTNNVKK